MDDADRKLVAGHVVPFAIWVGVIVLLQALETVFPLPRACYPWCYAAKSLVCAAIFAWFKPWRIYPSMCVRHLPGAVGLGVVIAALWILPETPWTARFAPAFQEFYHRWLILMPGTLPGYFNPDLYPALPAGHPSLAFSPEEAGWFLTLMKLAGSGCVIAVIEEFFFRGFFYRWMRSGSFWRVPLNVYDAQAFWMVVLVFGLEHDRWLMGLVAGIAYGWLVIRTGDVWSAAVSHGVTNLLLGLYVIFSRQYGFW